MKKILIIPWTLSEGGGSEKILNNILKWMINEEFEIEVFEIERGKKMDIIEKYPQMKIRYLFEKKDEQDSLRKKILRKIKMKALIYIPGIIKKMYLRNEYDFIISFNYLYPSFLAKKFKGKKMMWVHGTIYDLKENKQMQRYQKKAFERADKIISIADETQKSIDSIFPEVKEKSITVYNGYELPEIIQNESNLGTKSDLLAIGRLDKNKNFEFLIDVVKILKNRGLNYKLCLIGEGEERKNLQRKINDLNLNNQIQILGYQTDVYPYIINSKLLLVSSYSEGFPTVIVESLMHGKPFISTSVGGVKELSNAEKCGFIIDSNEEMAEKIKEILENYSMYDEMSKIAKVFVKKYDVEIQRKKILELLR